MDKSFILDHFKGGQLYSFIGAGGKTSALRRAADVLAKEGFQVLVSTSTKLGAGEFKEFGPVRMTDPEGLREAVRNRGAAGIQVLVRGEAGGKYLGFSKEDFEAIGRIPLGTILLVEADGSRRKPFKIPYPHEPVVPSNSARVFLLFAAGILGQPVGEDNTYNLEGVREILGEGPLFWSPENLKRTLSAGWLEDADLSRLHLMAAASDALEQQRPMRNLLADLHRRYRIPCSLTSVQEGRTEELLEDRIGALVLAAGRSSRMGELKQLLPLGDTCFLEDALRKYGAFAHELVAAIGWQGEAIRRAIPECGFRYRLVEGWEEGMGASLREGVEALGDVDRFLVTNCDLPLVEPETIARLLEAAGRHPEQIIVPRFQGRNGHPVVFPRCLAGLLREAKGDQGGREILRRQGFLPVDLEDPGICLDIDVYDDYLKIREMFS